MLIGYRKDKSIYLTRVTLYRTWAAGSSETTERHIPQHCNSDTHRGV